MVSQELCLAYFETVILATAVGLFLLLVPRDLPLGLVKQYLLAPLLRTRLGPPLIRLNNRFQYHLYRRVLAIDRWFEVKTGIMSSPLGNEKDYGISYLESPIKPLTTFTRQKASQHASPLFNLPAEIIDIITNHVLTPYQDLDKPYDFSTCYRRPGNLAPTKTHTSLLQTCQYFYTMYWYLPWTLSTHTFYLAWSNRRPDRCTTTHEMQFASHLIAHLHEDAPARRKEVSHVQVFAQLVSLEDGNDLSSILDIPSFMPRTVTITIRHTDWWSWESDSPMRITGTTFVSDCRFPLSTTTVNIEVESLARRAPQVDWMAAQMARQWHFTRVDGTHLVADASNNSVTSWKGSATWEDERWIRDEDDTEPNVLTYHVSTVSFRAIQEVDDPEGYQRRNEHGVPDSLYVDDEVAEKTRIRGRTSCVKVCDMQTAGISVDEANKVSASEVLRRVRDYEASTGGYGMVDDATEDEEDDDDVTDDDDDDDNSTDSEGGDEDENMDADEERDDDDDHDEDDDDEDDHDYHDGE